MSRAWMPMYWGDYLKNTRDLTTLQHGAYLLLIAHYWEHGSLPNDERRLAIIAGVSFHKWKVIAGSIAAKFHPEWRHPRIEEEILKAERRITQRHIAGQKGGHNSAVSRAISIAKSMTLPKRLLEQPATNHISKKEEESLSIRPRSVVDIVEEARRRRKGLGS